MKKQIIKNIIVFALVFSLLMGIVTDITEVSASSGPAAPSISLKAVSDGTGIKVTIKKTKNADGYSISIKAPGKAEYTEVKTLNRNGKKKRSITIPNLSSGEYSVEVRAFKTSGNTKKWGEYSYKTLL